MKKKKLHMIGNAHIDAVWLWRWQEGFQEVKASFRSALDRMKENPEFIFTASSSIFYEWVEENNPEMFEEIKARVAEGRWELAGGWIVEPDCNIPGGESFARHSLYGQGYFMEKFNVMARTGFNVDSFGHSGSLPQILSKSGLKNYVFMRPAPNEKSLPGRIFNWRSRDGSEVLAYRIPYEYCTWGKSLEKYCSRLETELDESDELMFFYGVGNHGGGPTRENINTIVELSAGKNEIAYTFSTTTAFFDSVRVNRAKFPVVQDDLQHHASGCYSAHSGVKQWNRRSENILMASEAMSVIAHIVENLPYPGDYKRAWKNVLFNQFHDIMAGTSLISAYDDARNMYGEAISIGERNLNNAIQSISWDIDIEENINMLPLVVFNTHAWAGAVVCETEIRDPGKDFFLTDDLGNEIRVQLVQSESVTNQKRLLFVGDAPSMGYRVYKLHKNGGTRVFSPVEATPVTLENDGLRLEINPESGYIKSLFDKKNNLEILRGEGARLSVIKDSSDTWSHNVFKFDNEICLMQPVYIKLIESGPVRSSIRVRYKYNDSYIVQEFRIYHDLDYIEVKVDIDWREPCTMVKLKFPVNMHFRKPVMEIPFGYIEKTVNGEEEAGQNWIDFSGEHSDKSILYGLAIANTAKYSYSFDVNEMCVTIINNSVYAHHDPAKLDPGTEYTYVDSGRQSFTYALHPHEGDWKNSRIAQVSGEINQRPIIIAETYHSGRQPQSCSFLSVDKPQIVISALKQAEDGSGIIVRAYETLNRETDAEIDLRFINRRIKASFAPCEIKTFKVPYEADKELIETDLLERAEGLSDNLKKY